MDKILLELNRYFYHDNHIYNWNRQSDWEIVQDLEFLKNQINERLKIAKKRAKESDKNIQKDNKI